MTEFHLSLPRSFDMRSLRYGQYAEHNLSIVVREQIAFRAQPIINANIEITKENRSFHAK